MDALMKDLMEHIERRNKIEAELRTQNGGFLLESYSNIARMAAGNKSFPASPGLPNLRRLKKPGKRIYGCNKVA